MEIVLTICGIIYVVGTSAAIISLSQRLDKAYTCISLLKDMCHELADLLEREHNHISLINETIQVSTNIIKKHDSQIDELNRFCGLNGYPIEAIDPSVINLYEFKKENDNE